MPILNSDVHPNNGLLVSTFFKPGASKREKYEIKCNELEDDVNRASKSYAAARFILVTQLEYCAEQFSAITKRKVELEKTKTWQRTLAEQKLKERIKSYAIAKVSLSVKLYLFQVAKAHLQTKQAEYRKLKMALDKLRG